MEGFVFSYHVIMIRAVLFRPSLYAGKRGRICAALLKLLNDTDAR
jgi:hypothetical protein